MRILCLAFAAALLCAGAATASPNNPVDGAEFQTLRQPQPAPLVNDKVEVLEFFMYHCPACNAVEPQLAAWVKNNSSRVNFRRIHFSSGNDKDYEARLFATLEALQLQDRLHDKVLETWHKEHRRLRSDAENLEWAVRNGIDKDKLLAAYNSFGVQMRLKSLARIAAAYGVDGTPTLIVNGKWVTEPSMVQAANRNLGRDELMPATLEVLNQLVNRSHQP